MTDPHTGPCTKGAPMPILPPCAVTVLVCNLPAARVTDMSMFVPPPPPPFPHPIVRGSMTVMIQKLPAARMGDMCSMGGTIIMGAPTVITGG
ncbi:hypothetical protein RGUI_3041 [Rhodovulum sp. P5]|uniref:PAAR domain-containing protein n=1 Tax=Rhodovulum sp. P5 TaxID=1564506 RepID=UPI0009C2C791|nr:PAAR domain-containing protein [Rhodovulum sp. P5]ARE41182.1 hypothetical protein RGUI_3041 [Rhodovulum sp. P5]